MFNEEAKPCFVFSLMYMRKIVEPCVTVWSCVEVMFCLGQSDEIMVKSVSS